MSYAVARLSLHEARGVWLFGARVRLEKALTKGPTLIGIEDIERDVFAGRMSLWGISDGTEARAYFVTEIVQGAHGSGVSVVALAGDRMDLWLAPLLSALDDYLRLVGGKYLIASGRPGWKRTLAHAGWVEGPVTMIKKAA